MASKRKYIDIIIPTKDRNDKLQKCLNALASGLSHEMTIYLYNVIIVKEHSSKYVDHEFFDIIKHPNYRFLNISYIVKRKSEGFTKAINTALSKSLSKKHKPDYIGFLHDDTIIFKNWLENLMKPMEENPKILGAGGITINELDEQCISKTYSLFNIDKKKLKKIKEASFENDEFIDTYLKDLNYYEFKDEQDSGYISLFSCLFKTSVFEKFGIFDDNLISSFRVEDEFCKRIIKNEKSLALVPQAFSLHECASLKNKDNQILRDATLYNIKMKNEINKNVSKRKNNYVVYTCMSEDETEMLNDNFNHHDTTNTTFICFTENNKSKNKIWKNVDIKPFLKIKDFKNNIQLLKEFIKLHPNYFFSNFKNSMWVDFDYVNMIPLNTQEFIKMMDKNAKFLSLASKDFNCSWKYLVNMFDEENLLDKSVKPIKFKDPTFNTKVLSLYTFYNFPKNLGLMDTTILVSNPNDKETQEILDKVWKNFSTIELDDKLWFNFIIWLYKKSYCSIPFKAYQAKMNEIHQKINEMNS